MWNKIIKAGLLGLGFCCLGITAGPDVQAVGLADASSRAAPTQEQLAAGEYTMNRFATMYGMEYQGMASSRLEAEMLAAKL